MKYTSIVLLFIWLGSATASFGSNLVTNVAQHMIAFSGKDFDAVCKLMDDICLPFKADASPGGILMGGDSVSDTYEWAFLVAHDGKHADKLLSTIKSEVERRGGTVTVKALTSKKPDVHLLDVRLIWRNTNSTPNERLDGIVTNVPNHQP